MSFYHAYSMQHTSNKSLLMHTKISHKRIINENNNKYS